MRKGGALSYLVADHLGGTALVTDGSGAFVGRTRYYPYPTQRTDEGVLARVWGEAAPAEGRRRASVWKAESPTAGRAGIRYDGSPIPEKPVI
jgi:hypothetical protein